MDGSIRAACRGSKTVQPRTSRFILISLAREGCVTGKNDPMCRSDFLLQRFTIIDDFFAHSLVRWQRAIAFLPKVNVR